MDLNDATLSISVTSAPTSETYPIVDAPSGHLFGEFQGLPEGAEIDGFAIHYDPEGGDVVLTPPMGTGVGTDPRAPVAAFYSRPNPSRGRCHVVYELNTSARVSLDVFDVGGRRVRTLLFDTLRGPGERREIWDGRTDAGASVPSGIYWLRLETGGRSFTAQQVEIR